MSTTTQSVPIFQYDFEAVNGKLTDLSGNGFDITLPPSGIAPANDPVMGSCLQFKGTADGFLTIPKLPYTGVSALSNGITISMWVNADTFAANTTPILLNFGGAQQIPGKNTTGANDIGLRLNGMTPYFNRDYIDQAAKKQGSAVLNSTEAITAGDWVHLAVTVDSSGCATLYKDGQVQASQTKPDFAPTAPTTPIPGNIGASAGSVVPPFKGMIGWLAVYNGVLQDIPKEMGLGQSNRHFVSNRSFPMDFKLFSNDAGADSPIMFIDSAGLDQTLDFHIVNTGKKPLSIPMGNSPVDANSNYHFQLKFRPGILSDKYVTKHTTGATAAEPLLTSSSWSTLLTKDAANNDVMSFLYIGNSAKSIDVGKEFVLQLDDINASATGGSKNTNVEFKYRGIDYGSSGTSAPQIEGHRTQNISIVNHTGDKNIPLRAEIAGMARVMTYHKSTGITAPRSDLMLHLINTDATNSLELGTTSSTDGATTFTLSVDVQPENEFMDWALFAQGEGDPKLVLDVIGVVRSFDASTSSITLQSPLAEPLDASTAIQIDRVSDTVTVGTNGAKAGSYTIPVSTTATTMVEGAVIQPTTGQGTWSVSPDSSVPDIVNNQMQWTISNNSAQSFEAGKGLSFLLTGLECSLPAGTSTVTIGYSNVPGHWDGSFALEVQKSPMSISQEKVGINILNPEANLHILEKDGSIPIRIGENNTSKKLPKPDNGLNYVITSLVPVDNTDNLFYDPIIRGPNGNQSQCTINFLSWDNGNSSIQPLSLSADTNTGTYVSNSGSYFFFLVQDYFRVYELSPDHDQLTFVIGPSITTEPGFPGANSTILGEVCYFQAIAAGMILPVNVSNPQSIPAASAQSLPSEIQRKVDFRASANYLYIIGTKHFYVLSQDSGPNASPSGLKLEGSVPYSAGGTVQLYEDIACLVSSNEITLVNIADATSPVISKTISTSNLETSGGVIFYKNFIFISGQDSPSLYAFDLNRENPGDHPMEVNLDTNLGFYNIGLCSDLIYLSQYSTAPTGSYDSVQTQFIKLADLYEYLTDKFSYITSKSIGLDVTRLPDNASLSIPYPKDSSRSGLSIGSGYASGPAAISVLVDEISTVDPVSIMSDYGEPILNIKRPSSRADPYRVGIGTDDPKAGLHVASTARMSVSNFGYLNQAGGGPTTFTGTQAPLVGIYTEDYIVAFQYFATSDVRIKDVLNLSKPGQDLSTLLSLQVSDYQYIDFIGKGAGQKKGLIAQQVKEVFPQAVSDQNTDFIPDIYAMATSLKWQQATSQLKVSLEKEHDLAVGDKVRLIADKSFEEKQVVAIPNNKSFVVADWNKPVEKLFVFGKEVHDFHTVDYDQVAMLGISAIQALHAEMESLKKENEALKAQMQSEMAELKAEWAAFKSSLTKQHQN